MARRKKVEEPQPVTITLDPDVFRWLHDMVKVKHEQQRYQAWIPAHQQMIDRAWASFQGADGTPEPEPEPVSAEPASAKRVIRKRVATKR